MFCFDVETLGVESTSVILSAAIIHWSPNEDFSYAELLRRACFVKFDAGAQIKLGRVIDKSTVEWWEKREHAAKDRSLKRRPDDLSPEDGIARLRDYYNQHKADNGIVWARGSLDQVAIDSLSRMIKVSDMAPYNVYRDVRTSIDLLCETAKNGYCEVAGLDRNAVVKHDPVHDCALDIMQMRYGK